MITQQGSVNTKFKGYNGDPRIIAAAVYDMIEQQISDAEKIGHTVDIKSLTVIYVGSVPTDLEITTKAYK